MMVSPPQLVRADLPVSEWSREWLGYTRYDGLVLTTRELESAPEVRPVLWRYVEAGGFLFLTGPGPDPATMLPTSWRKESSHAGLDHYTAGFGVCSVRLDAPAAWDQDARDHLLDHWKRGPTELEKYFGVSTMNSDFPVIDDEGIPIRSLFMLMVGFAFVIGPLNLWLLNRLKVRILLLVTVPAVSLLTCAAVFGTMLAVEGWRGHERIEVITYLDQEAHRSATAGWVGFYTPMAPSDGLHFGRETALAGMNVEENRRMSRMGRTYTVDWTEDQNLRRGWITARIPSVFRLRKTEANRRERLTLDRGGSGLAVTNALGVPVRKLVLADRDGQLYEATDIAEGQKVEIHATGATLKEEENERLPALFRSSWNLAMQRMQTNPARFLVPGSYLAILDDCPFVERGLRDADRRGLTLVYGMMGPGE